MSNEPVTTNEPKDDGKPYLLKSIGYLTENIIEIILESPSLGEKFIIHSIKREGTEDSYYMEYFDETGNQLGIRIPSVFTIFDHRMVGRAIESFIASTNNFAHHRKLFLWEKERSEEENLLLFDIQLFCERITTELDNRVYHSPELTIIQTFLDEEDAIGLVEWLLAEGPQRDIIANIVPPEASLWANIKKHYDALKHKNKE